MSEKYKLEKAHDPSDIHKTHGVGDPPPYIEESKLATERLELKRRLVADRREEELKARRLSMPEELEAARVAVEKRSEAAVQVQAGVGYRHNEWAKWADHVEDNYQERQQQATERVRVEGERLMADRERHLTINTGLPDDSLMLAFNDLTAEGRLYEQARDAYANASEVKEDFEKYGTVDQQLMDLRRRQVLGESELRQKEDYLRRMNRVREYVQELESDYTTSQDKLEHLEADLAARTERLKVAGPGMDFAARGAARRAVMEQKEQFEVLTGHVRAVRLERDAWREHVQFHGYNPDAVPPMKDIASLNVVEVLTREERMERKATEARRLLQERRDRQKAAKDDPYGSAKQQLHSQENLPEPPPLEEIIASAPPPEKGSFKDLVTKGHGMVQEDREIKKKNMQERREAIEDAAAAADREMIAAASRAMSSITGDDEEERIDLTELAMGNAGTTPPAATADDVPSSSTPASSAMEFQAPNVFYQRAEDDAMVSKLGGGAHVIGGVDASQVPPLCKKWVMLSCPLPATACHHRHYYTSNEEKARSVDKRQTVDAVLERRVVETLTQREDTLRLLRRASADATRKFMDHTDATVRDEDVKRLLDLLAQVRACTVEVVEAIVAWRNAVAEQRNKLQMNNGDEVDDPADQSEEAVRRRKRRKQDEKEKRTNIKMGGGSRSVPWRKDKVREPPKKDAGLVTTQPIKYSVKIAVEGEQLYGGAAPYKALLKRFNRDRTMPKKAVNWVFLGVCDTEGEAALLYDKARTEQAVAHATTAERMPKRRTFIRRCGHYAVESVDCGAPKSRCEVCYVNGLDKGSDLTVPFLWNGINYLSKIPHDLDFLKEVEPLRLYFGKEFPLSRNPFLLLRRLGQSVSKETSQAYQQQMEEKQQRLMDSMKNKKKKPSSPKASTSTMGGTVVERGLAFGVPGANVIRYDNGTTEWFGHMAVGGAFEIGDKHRMYDGFNQLPFGEREMKKFVKKNKGNTVSVVDVKRIEDAERVLLAEEDLAKLMTSLNSEKNQNRTNMMSAGESGGDTTDFGETARSNSGSERSEESPRSEMGNEMGASGTNQDRNGLPPVRGASPLKSNSRTSSSNKSSGKSDGIRSAESTTGSSSSSSSPSRKKHKKKKKKNKSSSSSPSRRNKNRNPAGEAAWDVESDDEIEVEEDREGVKKRHEKDTKEAELRSRMTRKIAYYEQGGVKMPVEQWRLPNPSKKPGLWMNPYEGEYKISFDGQKFNKYGFMVRGKRSQHNYFDIKLKVDGEKKRYLRSKVQRLLQKSIRNPDLIDVKRVGILIKFGREIKGSLVMLDCTRCEQALLKYRRRVEAAVHVQRIFRGHQRRTWAMSIRYERRLKLKLRVAHEVACSLTAKKLVEGYLRGGILAARNQIVEPEYSTTIDLESERCVVQVFRSSHHDWMHLKKTTQRCFSCLQWRPTARWNMGAQRMEVEHGPCCCKVQVPTERLFIRAYSPMRSIVYSLAITESDMKRRMLLDQYRRFGKGTIDTSVVMRALRHENLPETDYVLGLNVGIYRRTKFEPLKEAYIARDKNASTERIAIAAENYATKMETEYDEYEQRAENARQYAHRMKMLWLNTHADLLRSQVQLQALMHASSHAMNFVHASLKMFESGGVDTTLSIDPLENANDHVWIKRKYEAKKSMILRVLDREQARKVHLDAQSFKVTCIYESSLAKERAEIARERAIFRRKDRAKIEQQAATAQAIKKEVTARICEMLTLRTLPNSQLQRVLAFAEPEWDLTMPAPLRPVPLVFGGWNVRHREVRYIHGQSFCEKGHVPAKRLLMVSIMEDPHSKEMREQPPHTGMLVMIVYDPQSRERTLMSFGLNDLRDALGEKHPELFAPVEEDADTIMKCPTPGCYHRLRARRRLLSVAQSEPAFQQAPFTGLNIGVEGGHANGGGPVLRCPACQVVLKTNGPDRWSMVPSSTASAMKINKKDGNNNYDGQVNTFHTEPAASSAGRKGGMPSEDFELEKQKIVAFFHGGFTQRHAVFEERRRLVIDKLVESLRLSRFDQGTVCLDGLSYRACRRLFKGRVERTQWMKDHRRGRTSLKGLPIFTEGRKIGGRVVHISIHENHGDLVFEAYHSRSGYASTLLVSSVDVTQCLSDEPKWVEYWESSIRTCRYSSDLMRVVCDRLTFVVLPFGVGGVLPEWEGHARYETDERYSLKGKNQAKAIDYRGKCFGAGKGSDGKDGEYVRAGWEYPGYARGTRLETGNNAAPILVLRKAQRLSYEVRHQEHRIVSGKYVLCTVMENTRGEMLLEAHDPKTAQKHSLQLSREQCRVLLRKDLDLLCDRGTALWIKLCALMALRPDPEAGRAAVLRMNLSHLEEVAEEAALKCVETKRKINKVETALVDSKVETLRLRDLELAAKDVAANDGGAKQSIALLRMLEYNQQRTEKEHLRSRLVVKRLVELKSRLNDLLYEETLDRQRRLRASTSMRRLLVEQRTKDGLKLVLSDSRPDEHWKRIWFGTRAFGGYVHDLHQSVSSSSSNNSKSTIKNFDPVGDRDLKLKNPSRYVLLGAQWLVMEVLVRPRGTKTDTSDVWIRGRFETLWEKEQRTLQEECLLMASEERRTRDVLVITKAMKASLKEQRLAARKERSRLRAENRRIQAQLKMENESRLRLSRLTKMARTLGMEVGLVWSEKSGAAPSRPGTALNKSDKITLPGEDPAPPAPQAPMAGVPPTWNELQDDFPMNATRSIIGGTMDPRLQKQILNGSKTGGANGIGTGGYDDIDDDLWDESNAPRLHARGSRWGLSNSKTEGTTMYTSVFEMLRYKVGGTVLNRNNRHTQMFVEKEIMVPEWDGAKAVLVLAEDAFTTMKVIIDTQTAITEDEDTNYEEKTKAEQIIKSKEKEWQQVQESKAAAEDKYQESLELKEAHDYTVNRAKEFAEEGMVDPNLPPSTPVNRMYGLDIALPGAVFQRNWFDNPKTAGMYPSVAKMLQYDLMPHPSELALLEGDIAEEEEESELDEEALGIVGEGTAKLSVLNVQQRDNENNGKTLSRPGSARLRKSGGGRSSRPGSRGSAQTTRSSRRSSRPTSAGSAYSIDTHTGRRRKRKDHQLLVWLPEGMTGWTQQDLDDNDPFTITQKQQALKLKQEKMAVLAQQGNYRAQAKNTRIRPPSANGRQAEIEVIVLEDIVPTTAPPPTEVINALNARGAFFAQKGVPPTLRNWRRPTRNGKRQQPSSTSLANKAPPSFRFSHKAPMSMRNQKFMEEDAINMGKVWFRTVRNIPVGMTEREQVKAARNPKAVKQETRRVIVTVQTPQMPGRRYSSAVDLSSMLSIEMYDPLTSISHRSVIDVDDLQQEEWQKHVRMNRCVQSLVQHLRIQYDYDVEQKNKSKNKKISKSMSITTKGTMIGLSPACECYGIHVTERKRDIKYCKRSSLLPWACGSGSECYTTHKWKERSAAGMEAAPINHAARNPKPLFRGTRLLKDPQNGNKPYRVLVSAWRDMTSGNSRKDQKGDSGDGGGCRIDVYYPPTSQCWSMSVGPKELEIMAIKMDNNNAAKGGKNGAMKGGMMRETAEDIKLRQQVLYEEARLSVLIEWAPERKDILQARKKRAQKKRREKEERERIERVEEEDGTKSLASLTKPTPPARRQLNWIVDCLKLNRHPTNGSLNPPKKMKGRKKMWKERKKYETLEGKKKNLQNVSVQYIKGISSLMASSVINTCGKEMKHCETAQQWIKTVNHAVQKLMPVSKRMTEEEKHDSDDDNYGKEEEEGDGNNKGRHHSKKRKKKKTKHKKKEKKGMKEENEDNNNNTDVPFEGKAEYEQLFTDVFAQEVLDERQRIRPNTAYDDGSMSSSNTKKSQRRRQKTPSSTTTKNSADVLIDNSIDDDDENTNWSIQESKKTQETVVVRPPMYKGDYASDLPTHFSGIFIPQDPRVPLRLLYFKLDTWQQQIHSLLLEEGGLMEGEVNNTQYNQTNQYDGKEHRLAETLMSDAKKTFSRANVPVPISLKKQKVTMAGSSSSGSSQRLLLRKNEVKQIRRVTIKKKKQEKGSNDSSNNDAVVFHWTVTKKQSDGKKVGKKKEEDNNNDDDDGDTDDLGDVSEEEQKEEKEEKNDELLLKYHNIRASILTQSSHPSLDSSTTSSTDLSMISGDAVWMRRDADAECVALIEADRNASLRYIQEMYARKEQKEQKEEAARKERQQEKQQEKQKERDRQLSQLQKQKNNMPLRIEEVGSDDLPLKLDSSLNAILSLSYSTHKPAHLVRTDPSSIPLNKAEREEKERRRREAGEDDEDDENDEDDDTDEEEEEDDELKRKKKTYDIAVPIPEHTMDDDVLPDEKYASVLDLTLSRDNPARWRKGLKERRALRNTCRSKPQDESIVEAAHAKGTGKTL